MIKRPADYVRKRLQQGRFQASAGLPAPHLISLTSVHKAKPEAIPKWQQMTLDPHLALVTPRKLVKDLMEIHLHHAQSLGELIVDG